MLGNAVFILEWVVEKTLAKLPERDDSEGKNERQSLETGESTRREESDNFTVSS